MAAAVYYVPALRCCCAIQSNQHQWSFCFNEKAARATVHQRQQEVIAMIDLVRTDVATNSRMRLVSAQVLLASAFTHFDHLETCLFLVVMGILIALTMEALACRDGVTTLVQGVRAHNNLCTETECQELVKLWEARGKQRLNISVVLQEIREMSVSFNVVTLNYANRKCNRVAHELKKKPQVTGGWGVA
jgi:hypothetical protein